jgi:Flp pilus assembly protein TadD
VNNLQIKYATYAKASPPQPIRLKIPGWAGAADKMEDGSMGQPWHCLPFVEASTYGLELVYQFETECKVINDNGLVRFDWDYTNEPGGELTGAEFATFFPKEASKYYLFTTRIDIQAPAGYVVRTEPHPRFFTDDSGTVPCAIIGHLQTEWWARKLFVVFKVPAPGQQHIFRKGEPYAQIIFVPQRSAYELQKMTPDQEASRRKMDADIESARLQIADNIWQNSSGYQLSNHYKVLASAFGRDGQRGVEEVVGKAVEKHASTLPKDKTIAEYLELANQKLNQQKYQEAREIYQHVLSLDANNAEALSNLGICMACKGLGAAGLSLMSRAIALQPNSPAYHGNLGELLRMMGKFSEAEACFRSALQLVPGDPGYMSVLGQTLAHAGRASEGLQMLQDAAARADTIAVVHLRLGMVLAQQGQFAQARAAYEKSLAIDPNLGAARQALRQLPAAT